MYKPHHAINSQLTFYNDYLKNEKKINFLFSDFLVVFDVGINASNTATRKDLRT